MTALAATAANYPKKRARFSPIELLGIMGAAIRAANAVESHRQPRREDLVTLGITGEFPRAL